MGIQELEKTEQINKLSATDLEDLVGKYHIYAVFDTYSA
jgi:hypothetical protein